MIDVLVPCSGNPFVDIIFTGLPHVPAPGEDVIAENVTIVAGGSLTSAVVLTRLGYKVLYEAHLGRDFASRFLIETMENEGMPTDAVTIHDDARACVTVAYNHQNDRSFLSYEHPTPLPNPDLVDRYRPRAVLIDGLRLGEPLLETLRRSRRVGALRLADASDNAPTLAVPGFDELLAQLDVLNLNEREAMRLACRDRLEDALEILKARVPVIALKLGARGSRAFFPFGDVQLPAIPTTPVDFTGCGDNFFAALTAALLDGKLINECLAWGNAAGSLAATAPGGTSLRYTKKELLDLVDRHYGDLPPLDPLRLVTLEENE
ncbi:MAG: carbohydrate kinase family protein [Myxococcales bacterium]|nr:carbohydrate kinase family protein [Myxococcales bacterium]